MSTDTRDRLLDAAEQLFAERGFAATSLRDLTAVAEANLASVNYHFGSKETLLVEVFERRLGPVNGRRLALLDELESAAPDPRLEDLLWAYLAPPFETMRDQGESGRRFARLVGRVISDPARSTSEAFVAQFAAVRDRFHAAFARALPGLDATEVERRMHYVIGAMAHTFLWCENIGCLEPVPDDQPEAVLHSLIRFAASGMAAPVTPVRAPAAVVRGAGAGR